MCALYNPPVEELTEFNTAVFNQDDTPLTKMKSLFLGRVGNPISVATSTKFNGGDIYVQGARIGLGAGSIATNTAFGYNALVQNTTGANNLAIGYAALDANTFGFNNVAIGTNSAGAITTGSRNVAVGYEAFKTGTIYNNSVALGAATVIGGNQAVAIGYLASASDSQIVLGTSGETVLCKGTTGNGSLIASADIYVNGVRAGKGAGNRSDNVVLGQSALGVNTTGNSNVGLGSQCLFSNQTGSDNNAIGYQSLYWNTGNKNTAVGSSSLSQNSSGVENTAIGYASLQANTVGKNNVAVGFEAFKTLSYINNSTAVGALTVIGGASSTAIGYGATTTGGNQIVFGRSSETVYCPGTSTNGSLVASADIYAKSSIRMGMGNNNTYTTPDVSEQTAFGYNCHKSTNITRTGSTGFGYNCLGSASYRGGNNTGVGSGCLQALTTASSITAIGYNAGKSTTSPSANTFVGASSGVNVTSGSNNTLVGAVLTPASGALVSGTYNTLIGNNVETGENPKSCSSLGAYTYVGDFTRSTAIGGGNDSVAGATCTVSNQIMLGTSTEFVQCPGTSDTGSIKLGSSIQLQSSYSAAPTELMLGYQIEGSETFTEYILPETATSTSINLTAGVWSISITYEFKNVSTTTDTFVKYNYMYISLTNGGTYDDRYLYGGTIGFNYMASAEPLIYPYNFSPYVPEIVSYVYSSSFTYYTGSSVTLYPTFYMFQTGGTLNIIIRYTATRIA